jgi:hypothetical protein
MNGIAFVMSPRARAPALLAGVYVAGAAQFTSGGKASTAIAVAERTNRTASEIPSLRLEKESIEHPPIRSKYFRRRNPSLFPLLSSKCRDVSRTRRNPPGIPSEKIVRIRTQVYAFDTAHALGEF